MTADLKPWFAVAIPHEDIRAGRLEEAVFAANLWAVVHKEAPEVYLDPQSFYNKTYLTTGLRNVITKIAHALSGKSDAGDRILSLQTTFGGGKTHALVALWHLANHADILKNTDAGAALKPLLHALPDKISAAAFTNRTCDATQGRKTSTGIHTHTMWGELALQLGGPELYRIIEANDRNRSVPQGLFTEILRKASPCLILLDEVADYCVGASAVEVGSTTMADQTISFIQELTDAVAAVKGAAVVATLPASGLEVAGSEKGQEILTRLEKRFGRMGADVKPVADEEIYEVVRRRLFDSLGDVREHEKTASLYMKMYEQHKNEVPPEALKGTYRERMVRAYPFHPSMIDALNLRWASHGDFQRTRGVLRLLAGIVGDLWQKRQNETQSQPLIHPCHVRWTIDALHAALTRFWGAAYEAVVSADVIGEKANAVVIDEERGEEYRTQRVSQGLSSSILLGSFGGQADKTGYSTRELKLCVSRPGVNWGYTDGALLALEDRAFYLRFPTADTLGKRYWFGTKPTLVNLIVRYRQRYAATDFTPEILEKLQDEIKGMKMEPATWRVLVNPGDDLPEQKSLTLLIMHPDYAYSGDKSSSSDERISLPERILNLGRKCGTQERRYANTLLYLLPSQQGLQRLQNAFREVKALEAVKEDYGDQLDESDGKELAARLEKARKSVTVSLGSAYTHITRIDGQKVETVPLGDLKADFSDHLKALWRQIVEDEEWVLRKVGSVTLQKAGLVPKEGGFRVSEAVETFLRYSDKPLIASRHSVMQGLATACNDRMIGIGRGVNVNNLQRKWCGEELVIDPNEEGLWIIPPFEEEKPPPGPPPEKPVGADDDDITINVIPIKEPEPGGPDSDGKKIRHIKISGQVPMESWAELFRCFVGPAGRMALKQLRLGVDIEMATQEGQPLDKNDPKLKAMKESARQLGLTLEDD